MRRELELELICGTYEEFVVGYQLFKYVGTEEVRLTMLVTFFGCASSSLTVLCGSATLLTVLRAFS